MLTLFLSTRRPVPSILILYLLLVGSACHMIPEDVHFPLSLPLMLCSITLWPGFRGFWSLVCSDHLMPSLFIFSMNACSLSSADSWNVLTIWYLPSSTESFSCSMPLRCLPKSICAGVLSRSLMGVFLYSNSAAAAFSSSRRWPPCSAALRILFILFTPVSALRLACGL